MAHGGLKKDWATYLTTLWENFTSDGSLFTTTIELTWKVKYATWVIAAGLLGPFNTL